MFSKLVIFIYYSTKIALRRAIFSFRLPLEFPLPQPLLRLAPLALALPLADFYAIYQRALLQPSFVLALYTILATLHHSSSV